MTRGYKVTNGRTDFPAILFVVSNYPSLNKVATRGFLKMPNITKTDIGIWKIKKLKS